MSKFWNLLKATPVVFGASLLIANGATAQTVESVDDTGNTINQIDNYIGGNEDITEMDQVTNVSELKDVSPGDWAYEALRSLVERYGCIAGYPNGTFRGNRPMTRYEFAAGLNACLNQVERLISESQATTQEDIDKLSRLVQEFQSELAALGTRVDDLEGRVAFLEDHQFSTTTKLKGEVIFNVGNAFGDKKAEGNPCCGNDIDEQVTFSDRVRLNFESSFYGKDMLRVRLQAANITNFGTATGTNMAKLAFDENNGNSVEIDDLFYRYPFNDKLNVFIGAKGLDIDDIFERSNPYFSDSGKGALSRFGRYNNLIFRAPGGTGFGFQYKLSDQLGFNAAYLTRSNPVSSTIDQSASDPKDEGGLFNGDYSATAQLTFKPTDKIGFALTYSRTYEPSNEVRIVNTGSDLASKPFGAVDTSADRLGFGADFKVADQFNISGWFGYAKAYNEQVGNNGESADLITWAVALAFPDLFSEGSTGGLIFGQPPKVTSNDIVANEDKDSSFHIEALYTYKLNNNIQITPGLLVILNPDNDENNDTVYVGTIRTTFSF
jgi:Carbohydrate-selective porin, OprB family/S-layer homology domain